MIDYLQKYGYTPNPEAISKSISLIAANLDNVVSKEVLKDCFSMMDLTTLRTNDTEAHVEKLVGKVAKFAETYPEYPIPASVCVYPNFASTVKSCRHTEDLHITVVSACFPSSQSFLEVKVRETELAVEQGADEIDIVLALNSFLAEDYETAAHEIREIRTAIDKVAQTQNRKVCLKVILETGLLVTPENIAIASFLAMESGADFIKTSTGKVDVNATPTAAFIMSECIKKYYEATGKKVGFKPAGGIANARDAVSYYSIVANVLGKDWLNKELFRFGVSRVANSILSEIEEKTINFF